MIAKAGLIKKGDYMNSKIEKFLSDNLEKTIKYNPKDDGTLIGLPYKYTVPCVSDMFQEIYYWDTYFTNVGLIELGRVELAKGNADNMMFLIDKFGFMPNGSRTYYLNRSQPPYLSLMVRDIFAVTNDKEWLKKAYVSLTKEYEFWQTKKILKNGLNGYTNYPVDIIDDAAEFAKDFIARTGYEQPEIFDDDIVNKICQSYSSVAESGWDCNSRVLADGPDYASVDLNSLLYGLEKNMADFARVLENGEERIWEDRSLERLNKMQSLWDEERGIFIDYNTKTEKFSDYVSAGSFYPLFVGLASKEQAEKSVKNLIESLELKYGLSSGEIDPKWNCQWDYPNVWAPMQYIAYKGLMNYGFSEDAERLAKKYISLLENGFEETGNFWEKYNGNTGEVTTNEYDAPPMMGWTAGVYIHFCKELNK